MSGDHQHAHPHNHNDHDCGHDHADDHGHEKQPGGCAHSHGGHSHGGFHLGHSHGGHSHGPASYDKAFAIGTALNLIFVVAEAFYGVMAGSLSLLADAGHNLSDVFGLLLAWGAVWLTRKRASARRTYGFGRSTILASLINAVVLLIGVGGIAWAAVERLMQPQPVEGGIVMLVAAIGIVINGGTALALMRGNKNDLNIRGAFLHMVADTLVSLGVVIAALIMQLTGWLWLDPLVSLAIVAVIAIGTWGLFRDSLNLSLDAVPASIDRQEVLEYLSALPDVVSVHDLHIWPLSTTSVALTAHLVKPAAQVDDAALHEIAQTLKDRFGIDHSTIQIEHGEDGCGLLEVHQI